MALDGTVERARNGVAVLQRPRAPVEHWRLIRKLDSIALLTEQDRDAIARLPLRLRKVRRGFDFGREAATLKEYCVLLEGLLCRYTLVDDGARQIVSFHIPGDMLDLEPAHMPGLDHGIAALAASRVAFVSHAAVADLAKLFPNIAAALSRDLQVEAALYRQWLTGMGRRSAKRRFAHLICETFMRLEAVGLTRGDRFELPLTQAQLSDALGISSVHVNRILQELRLEGLVSWRAGVVAIPDPERLRRAGDFDSSYLHLRRMVGAASC